MASKPAKKTPSSTRAGSASNKEAASIAASLGDRRQQRFVIWPEWSDNDINAEKWDVAHKGKEKEKGKSPVVQHLFDDPDGKIEMPPSLKVDQWKRPQDHIVEKTPTVVDLDFQSSFDLLTPNEHIQNSELIRWITSEILALWRVTTSKNVPVEAAEPGAPPEEEFTHAWRPWEHIYAINKATKAPNMPAYNPHGKYAVKLYWMGCWRKIIIDDTLPFNENDQMLLPATANEHELWPMLLTKALIKVASLDYNGGSSCCEFGDFSVINCLTGWLPETIPLHALYQICREQYEQEKFCLHAMESEGTLTEDTGDYVIQTESVTEGCADGVMQGISLLQNFRNCIPLDAFVNEKSRVHVTPSSSVTEEENCEDSVTEDSSVPENSGDCITQDDSITEDSSVPENSGDYVTQDDSVTKNCGDHATKDRPVRLNEYGHLHEIWNLLKTALPEWKLPEPEPEKTPEGEEQAKDVNVPEGSKEDKTDKESKDGKTEKTDPKAVKDIKDKKDDKAKDKAKDSKDGKDKKDKDKDKEKEKKEKSMLIDESMVPDHPEVVVFASYSGPPKYPVRISVLGEMADASERLRQSGLSHMYPHPVLITQTRSCPLEPPPPPEKIPAWKLIRPRKKRTTPSDEPIEPEKEKPIQCVEITSPYVNYKVSPVPIPTDIHRPKSSLERGGTRPPTRTASVAAIEETDENAPEPEPEPEPEPKKEEEPKPESPKPEEPKIEPPEATPPSGKGSKPSTAGKKKGSAKKGEKEKEASKEPESPRDSKKPGTPKDRKRSASVRDKDKSQGDLKGGKEVKEKTEVKDKDAKQSANKAEQGAAVPNLPEQEVEADPLAVPGEEEQVLPEGEQVPEEEQEEEAEPKPQEVWMDFENFCKCFKTLYIYHKPATYLGNHKHAEFKSMVSVSREKKSAPPTAAVNLSSSSTAQSSSRASAQNAPLFQLTPRDDDKAPHYMFVDNLKPTEIVVSFSALSRWNEPPPPPMKEKDSSTGVKGGKDKAKDAIPEAFTTESSTVMDGSTGEAPPQPPPQPGLLVAEPYSWKSLVTGQPILRLRSTATRAAVLSLPAGRHVLRFQMSAPLGYHVHLCSTVPFVFGDEEKVMAELTNESCRFVDNATQVMLSLGKCIQAFNDPEMSKVTMEEFINNHCPYRNDKHMSKQYHFRVFNDALYQTLKKALADGQALVPEMSFAWRAFNFDATTKNILGLPFSSRPGEPQENKLEHWLNREITPEEHVAAIKVQKVWRGYWVRKMKFARTPGTEENLKVQEQLLKAWAVMEPNAEQLGLFLFRTMFKADPDLMPKYPFHQDEWNKISYADYQGSHPEQPPNTWFTVFREIFFVSEEMLCVPKLYVPIPTCMLRVVNNDTGEEVPRVFQKVAPYVYKKNRRGYTFVAEARTQDQALQAGRWRMRLIGALSPMPAPLRNEVNSSFHTRELRDYYIPNEKNIILRYAVKVTEDHLASLQMMTSKSDVYIKLQVLDNEEEVASAVGKGHVVLPSYIFLKDHITEEESKRSSSRSSNKGGHAKLHATVSKDSLAGKGKRGGSASREGRAASRSSTRHSVVSIDNEEEDLKPHKYIIQAVVLRNSWPLSESSWTFVQMLKEMEKNELKVAVKERPPSPPKNEKAASGASGKSKGKGKDKDKGGKDKGHGSRPPSQQFDLTKPNWTLRIVSDGSASEEVEVKKDTERADEIRAMKKAWEEAEPGRAAKAMQSRLQYLNKNMVKVQDEEEQKEEEDKATEGGDSVGPGPVGSGAPESAASPVPLSGLDVVESEAVLTLEPPPPPVPKEVLQPIDITPFIRKTADKPRLLDEEELQRQTDAKQQEIQNYRSYREEVEARREQDRINRNMIKVRQLQMCEDMQAALDAAREAVYQPREAFRQRFLEAERKRLEEIAAQEAALRAEQEKNAPSPKGRKSAKGKKSPSGKKKK